jgi:hypothetical protein
MSHQMAEVPREFMAIVVARVSLSNRSETEGERGEGETARG